MGFNPHDPYSSAMDNIPLKDLFPNVKVRKRPQDRKVQASDTPALRTTDNQDSVRNKFRQSLATALGNLDHELQECKSREKNERKMKRELQGMDSEHVLAVGSLGPDWRDGVNRSDPKEHGGGFLVDKIAYPQEAPYKRLKVEAENTVVEDKNQPQAYEQAEKVALDIEGELFRQHGGVNRNYKEKARSLLLNLKGQNNPQLWTGVLCGLISPQDLCSMSAEQLASKELSQWGIAKAEDLGQVAVLADANAEQQSLVKKGQKVEFEVKAEKDDTLIDVVTVGVNQRFALGVAEAETEGPEFSPIRDPVMMSMSGVDQVYDANHGSLQNKDHKESWEVRVKPSLLEDVDKDERLPTIMSLDEYLGSKKHRELKATFKAEGVKEMKNHAPTQLTETNPPFLTSSKISDPRKSVGSPKLKSLQSGSAKSGSLLHKESKKGHRKHEKLWEGTFQLSGCQISPVHAFYKSGDSMELHSWPTLVEIKGRVRLDALDIFLQELRISRTRSTMIMACRVEEGRAQNGISVNAMKEAANQYQKGERVGYAEPAAGFELYLFPSGGISLKLLVEHGYLSANQILAEEEGILIGFVVCRRSTISTNTAQKTSSQYFSANRHALSGQLESPTRPNEVHWSGRASAPLKTSSIPLPTSRLPLNSEFEDKNSNISLAIAPSSVSSPIIKVEDMLAATKKSTPSGLKHVEQALPITDMIHSRASQAPQDPRSGKFKALTDWSPKTFTREYSTSDDLPPGFGPKAIQSGIELSTVQHDDDDDDLPEFDFAVQSTLPVPPNFAARMPEGSKGGTHPLSQSSGILSSFSQGSVFPQIPQTSEGSHGSSLQPITFGPFEQHSATVPSSSYFSSPILSQIHRSLEKVNTSQQLSQVIQQSHFHALRPPPPSVPSPVQPLISFPSRPHIPRDGSFVARPPNVTQIAVPGMMPENKSTVSVPCGDRSRPEHFPHFHQEHRMNTEHTGEPNHPTPSSHAQNTMNSMDLRHSSTMQARNLWDDDDDMPEWCPPHLQQETPEFPIHPMPPILQTRHPSLVKGTSEPSMAMRTVVSQSTGQGWQGMPPRLVPDKRNGSLSAEGKGLLRAPAPALWHSGPSGGAILPAVRSELLSADRSMHQFDRELKRGT